MSFGKIIFCSVSENQSILVMPPWRNWSLLTAITASMLLHFLILYAPFMKVWFCRMFFLNLQNCIDSNWPFATVHTAVDVFKNGPSKICRKQPLKNLKWYGQRRQQNYVKENCSKLALKAPKEGQTMRNLEQISLTHLA